MVKHNIIGRARSPICREITDLIIDYVTGTLDPETTWEFGEHLRNCEDCVAFLNTYRKTVQVTQSLRYERIPPEMARRIRLFLQERMKKRRRGR